MWVLLTKKKKSLSQILLWFQCRVSYLPCRFCPLIITFHAAATSGLLARHSYKHSTSLHCCKAEVLIPCEKGYSWKDCISLSFGKETCMPCPGKKNASWGGREKSELERERESEKVENGIRGKLNGIKTHRERRRLSEKGSLASFDGPGREQGPSFISGVCHCGDSCSHQHQPRGIRGSARGKMKE